MIFSSTDTPNSPAAGQSDNSFVVGASTDDTAASTVVPQTITDEDDSSTVLDQSTAVADDVALSDESTVSPDVAPTTYVEAISTVPTNKKIVTGSDDLLELKQQVLTDLTPLVDQLDQTPDEKFRTTMMMIQSTDNSTLIKDAYEAAQAIEDAKVRAQALLDVVNEINYFTQQSPDQQD